MTEVVERITINGTPYTQEELAELLGLDSLASLDETDLTALLDEANQDAARQLSEFIAAVALASALALLSNPTPGIRYFTPRQRYYRGRTSVPQERIQQLIDNHRRQSSRRTLRHARDLLGDRITLRDYHQRMARDIVNGHIRMMQLGAGGRRQVTNAHWERLKDQLYGDGPGRGDLRRLQRHVERIQNGTLTEAQIRDRSRRYGANVAPSYEDARHSSLVQDGRWEGRRFLDPFAAHCEDCPAYEQPDWAPASEIVPVGSACRCRGNCRCRTEFRLIQAGFNGVGFTETVLG
ncbi:MAG: hypothetical protein AAF810_21280 [Cyanobacteria bacterium P01_D01_bin.36]